MVRCAALTWVLYGLAVAVCAAFVAALFWLPRRNNRLLVRRRRRR